MTDKLPFRAATGTLVALTGPYEPNLTSVERYVPGTRAGAGHPSLDDAVRAALGGEGDWTGTDARRSDEPDNEQHEHDDDEQADEAVSRSGDSQDGGGQHEWSFPWSAGRVPTLTVPLCSQRRPRANGFCVADNG